MGSLLQNMVNGTDSDPTTGGNQLSKSQAGWRDSNWYVGFSRFWHEYRKHRLGILGIGILGLFVGMAIFAPFIATEDPTPTTTIAPKFLAPIWLSVFDQSGVVTDDYLPDLYLENAPIIGTNGTSDEFSGIHVPTSDLSNQSYVNLTWSHTAGTPLDFRDHHTELQSEDPLPDYNDWVYFETNFTWPFNSNPNAVNMSISYSTTLSGDFAPGGFPNNNLMFRLYVWIIDPSGNWMQVFEDRESTYSELTREIPISMTYQKLSSIFGGMIEVNGTQEDPTDLVRVRVGLAPTFRFESYGGDIPWANYTGGVTFTVTKLKLFASGDYFGLMGTTNQGADAFAQLIYGSRISLIIGVLATGIATFVGVVVGLVAGYFGGKTDEVLMRIVDFLLVIPGLPLMMVLAAFLGASTENIIIVIAILGWTGTSRLIRSQVLAEKNKAYVESARAIGASDTYIMFKHILPNVTPILFANITLGVVGAILSEAGLSFLGLTDPEEPSWGRMLADASGGGAFIRGAWWVVLFPGLMITLLSLSFTFVGHTLDQVLNPRLRER